VAEQHRLLLQAGATTELLSFDGGHSIEADLFSAMRQFLQHCWSPTDTGSER
jgi:predicted esterase